MKDRRMEQLFKVIKFRIFVLELITYHLIIMSVEHNGLLVPLFCSQTNWEAP